MSPDLARRDALAALGALGLASLPGLAPAAQPQSPGRPPFPTEPVNPGSPLPLSPLKPDQLGWDPLRREFVLPALPFKPEALEPHLDRETITVHHQRLHAEHVRGANSALRRLAEFRDNQGDVSLVRHWSGELAFHLSGHMNHCYLWATLAPAGQGGGTLPGASSVAPDLAAALARDFGSVDKFITHLRHAALQVRGSGWAWLVFHRDTEMLMVLQCEDHHHMAAGGFIPLFGVDMWEHAYFLKHKADRAAYFDALLKVVAWGRVGEFFTKARSR